MHCNITQAITVKVRIWMPRHTTPLTHFFFGGVTATPPSRDLTDSKKKRREGSSRGESKRNLLKETQNQGKETRKKKRTQVEYKVEGAQDRRRRRKPGGRKETPNTRKRGGDAQSCSAAHKFPINCSRGGGLPGAGTYVAPSLNHAGCVITTSGVFSFLFFKRRWQHLQRLYDRAIQGLKRVKKLTSKLYVLLLNFLSISNIPFHPIPRKRACNSDKIKLRRQ